MHADELATTGLQQLCPKQRVPLDPDSKVQLHFEGMTITRNLNKTIRELIQLQPLKEYYCRRFDWTIDGFDSIDWDIFSPVYKREAKKGLQFANKFGTKNLPTGERMRRRCGNEDERCCSCGQAIETDDHLFQCPGRKQYKRQIIGALKRADKGMEPTLYRILKAGIVNFLTGNIDSFLHTCKMMMTRTRNRVFPKQVHLLDRKFAKMDGSDKNTHLKYQKYHQLLGEQEIIG